MNAPLQTARPAADRRAMLDALQALFEPSDVIELRALHKGKKRTDAGCFDADHWPVLVECAERLNNQGAAVYVTLNPVNPQLLGRYNNRMQDYAEATATDAEIVTRRWLLVDIDPKRPKNTSATRAQLAAAQATAQAVYEHLQREMGWPDPIVGESGNGMHLLYPLELPNDTASRDLVKAALQGLAARFNDAMVSIDVAVFNAGRITKLYGTVANKGDHTDAAPWRLSRLISTPKRGASVTVAQLQEVAQLRSDNDHGGNTTAALHHAGSGFDLPGFLSRLGIGYDQDTHEGSDRYKLHHCPFNPEHGKGEAAVFRKPSGALGFKCLHNSCADNNWHKLRDLVDGPRESRSVPQVDISRILGQGQPIPQLPALPQLPEAPAPTFDLDFPPGLIGRMAEHVLAASRCGVKSYAIVAALITASFLIRGTSWVEGSNTPLNLYTCMIGETGKGKEEPRRGVKRLVRIVGRIGGVVEGVASGPALLRAMAVEPNRLLLTDEFGMFLQAALADHGSIHLKELTKEILSLFGLGRSVYAGRCYSDAKLNIDPIENPYLCVMGTTTSTELMEALNRRSVDSGLMNRFLFIEAVGMEPINRFVDDQVPEDLEKDINAQFGNFGPSGAIGYDDGAHELMVDLATAMANDALGEFAAMWSRSEELMIRVAGVLAVGDGRTITTRHIDWAHRFVRWSIESMLQRMGREMHETDFDRQCKRVVEIIGNPRKYADDRKFSDDLQQGYMPHAKLLKLMKMKAKEFQDLISTLLESQQIEVIKVPSSGKDKVLYVLQR